MIKKDGVGHISRHFSYKTRTNPTWSEGLIDSSVVRFYFFPLNSNRPLWSFMISHRVLPFQP